MDTHGHGSWCRDAASLGREQRLDAVGLGNADLHQPGEYIVHLGAEWMRGMAKRCISLEHELQPFCHPRAKPGVDPKERVGRLSP